MTYSGAHEPQVRIPAVALVASTLAFLAGVVCALIANAILLEMLQEWTSKWECQAQGWTDGKEKHQAEAMKLKARSRCLIYASLGCFVVGVCLLEGLTFANNGFVYFASGMAHTLSIVGLIFNVLAAALLVKWPPRTDVQYTEKGEAVGSWVGAPAPEALRKGKRQKWLSQLGLWVLGIGFLFQLIAVCIS
jgi:hypothetical protein